MPPITPQTLFTLWWIAAGASLFLVAIYESVRRSSGATRKRRVRGKQPFSQVQRPDGVYDLEEAERMFHQIQKHASTVFGFIPPSHVAVHVVSQGELDRLTQKSMGRSGYMGLCHRGKHGVVIYVVRGLPRPSFYATLAHEYAHVWQFTEGFLHGKFERIEGFAEWISLVLTQYAGYGIPPDFYRGEKDPYGTGMRRFNALAELFGLRKAAELAKRPKLDISILRANYDALRPKTSAAKDKPQKAWTRA